MSGGAYDYIQCRLDEVVGRMVKEISLFGKTLTQQDYDRLDESDKWWHEVGEPLGKITSEEALKRFRECAEIVAKARIAIERADYLVSGDDGDDSFVKRYDEEMDALGKSMADGSFFNPEKYFD